MKIVHDCFKSQEMQVIDKNDVVILGGVPVIKNGRKADKIRKKFESEQKLKDII